MKTISIHKFKIPHIRKIVQLSKKYNVDIFLVGGALRDAFLCRNQNIRDFDFAVSGNTFQICKKFSSQINSKVIILDEFFGSFRVVYKKGKDIFNYDFTQFRGPTLEEDLKRRDFTINTLSLNIKDFFKRKWLILDFLNSQQDFKKRYVRAISKTSFLEDPLRILRTFSLASILNFKIEKKTLSFIKSSKHLLGEVAGERISEELFKILNNDNSFLYFYMMEKLKVLDVIFPEIKPARKIGRGGYHHLNVWLHSLETLKEYESLYRRKLIKNPNIKQYLDEVISSGHRRHQLLKLGCLFHDIGKPLSYARKGKKTIFYGHEKIGEEIVCKISERLKLSCKEKQILRKMVLFHLRPGFMTQDGFPTRRALYRYFRDTQEEGLSILFLSIADIKATRGRLASLKDKAKKEKILLKIAEDFFIQKKEKKRKKIFDGYLVMNTLKLSPSPLVGKILKRLEEYQALGEITTKKEAIKKMKEIYEEVKENI